MHTKRQIGSHSLLGCVPFFPSAWKSGNVTSGPVLHRRIRSTERLNEMTGKCTLNSGSWQRSRSSRDVKVPVVSEGIAGQGVLPERPKKAEAAKPFGVKPGLLRRPHHFSPSVGPEAPGYCSHTSLGMSRATQSHYCCNTRAVYRFSRSPQVLCISNKLVKSCNS